MKILLNCLFLLSINITSLIKSQNLNNEINELDYHPDKETLLNGFRNQREFKVMHKSSGRNSIQYNINPRSDISGSTRLTIIKTTYRKDLFREGSCFVSIKDHGLFIRNCSGMVKITTSYGIFEVTCETAHRGSYYGPLLIQYSNCNATLVGDRLCSFVTLGEKTMEDACDQGNIIPYWLLSVLMFIVLFQNLIFARYIYLRTFYSPSGSIRKSSSGGLLSFILSYYVINEEGKESEEFELIEENVSKSRKKVYKEIKITPCMVIMYVLLLNLCVKIEAKMSGPTYKDLRTSEGSTIVGRMGSFYVETARQEFPLTWKYFTSIYEHDLNYQMMCRSSVCNKDIPCKAVGPRGKWLTDKLNDTSMFHKTAIKYHCFYSGGVCLFADSCWKWNVTLKINKGFEAAVYEIGQSITNIVIKDSVLDNSAIVTARLQDSFQTGKYSIISFGFGIFYICPYAHNSMAPLAGRLGDVQYNAENYFTVADNLVTCTAGTMSEPRCDFVTSFMVNMKKLCKLLPTQIGSFRVFMNDSTLVAKKESNVVLTVVSDDLNDWGLSSNSCGKAEIHVWGVKGGPDPYTTSIRSQYCVLDHQASYILPCTGEAVTIICDCKYRMFEISSPTLCRDSLEGINVTEINFGDINLIKVHAIEGHLQHDNQSWLDRIFGGFKGVGIIGGLFGGSSTITIIIIILIIRK